MFLPMKLKGFAKFREKVPILEGKKVIILPIYLLVVVLVFVTTISLLYRVPTLSSPFSGFVPIGGILVIEFFALFLVFLMWNRKNKLLDAYPKTAYQRIIFIGLGGITVMIALAFNCLLPLAWIEPDVWRVPPFSYFGDSLFSLIDGNWLFVDIIRYILASLVLLVGIMTVIRSLLTFGLDYMALVYLYYPEQSEVQHYDIYSILRHPTYAGLILICLAGFLFNFTVFHLLYFILFVTGFSIHIFFVEEKELITRFGDSYRVYRRKVPAIWVRPKQWKKFFYFLYGYITFQTQRISTG